LAGQLKDTGQAGAVMVATAETVFVAVTSIVTVVAVERVVRSIVVVSVTCVEVRVI